MPSQTHERSPKSKRYGDYSRTLDLTLLVVCALPALLICGTLGLINACIFRDPRRAFFRQHRVGKDGKTFTLFKFRTLRDELEKDGKPLTDQERVTRFGRILRNTHLDELPQLWNVLLGDMGIVGPRPEMISVHEWATGELKGFERRLAIRPGITGLAQITQGYAQPESPDYERKLELDLQYLAHRSLATDCKLLVGTIVWMIRGKGWDWKPVQEAAPATAPGPKSVPQESDEQKRAA